MEILYRTNDARSKTIFIVSNFEKTNSDPQKYLVTLTIISVQIMCECVYQFTCVLCNLFIFIYVQVLSSCLCPWSQKRTSGPLDLKLRMSVNQHLGTGN